MTRAEPVTHDRGQLLRTVGLLCSFDEEILLFQPHGACRLGDRLHRRSGTRLRQHGDGGWRIVALYEIHRAREFGHALHDGRSQPLHVLDLHGIVGGHGRELIDAGEDDRDSCFMFAQERVLRIQQIRSCGTLGAPDFQQQSR